MANDSFKTGSLGLPFHHGSGVSTRCHALKTFLHRDHLADNALAAIMANSGEEDPDNVPDLIVRCYVELADMLVEVLSPTAHVETCYATLTGAVCRARDMMVRVFGVEEVGKHRIMHFLLHLPRIALDFGSIHVAMEDISECFHRVTKTVCFLSLALLRIKRLFSPARSLIT